MPRRVRSLLLRENLKTKSSKPLFLEHTQKPKIGFRKLWGKNKDEPRKNNRKKFAHPPPHIGHPFDPVRSGSRRIPQRRDGCRGECALSFFGKIKKKNRRFYVKPVLGSWYFFCKTSRQGRCYVGSLLLWF